VIHALGLPAPAGGVEAENGGGVGSGHSGHAEPLMMSTKSARVKPGMK
jgi:hypothetical protein